MTGLVAEKLKLDNLKVSKQDLESGIFDKAGISIGKKQIKIKDNNYEEAWIEIVKAKD
jgi:hypothetical protein